MNGDKAQAQEEKQQHAMCSLAAVCALAHACIVLVVRWVGLLVCWFVGLLFPWLLVCCVCGTAGVDQT